MDLADADVPARGRRTHRRDAGRTGRLRPACGAVELALRDEDPVRRAQERLRAAAEDHLLDRSAHPAATARALRPAPARAHYARRLRTASQDAQAEPETKQGPATLSLLTKCPDFDYLWAGSDESGKGDFFGPLVVAAVLINKDIAGKLYNFGVRDSKELSDKRILELAEKIEALAPLHAVLPLKPEAYNLRYQQMKAQGYNLNHLLAAGHIAALTKVLKEDKQCHFALVDRFNQKNNIAQELQRSFPNLTVVQQPRAEEDMAVAAASILARAKFVNIMQELSTLAGMELPKGGGENATDCARKILANHDEEFLNKLVKNHFANYLRLKD